MSLSAPLLHYFAARHNELIDERMERRRKLQAENLERVTMRELEGRVMQLEGDLARSLLLLQSLAEICVSKGLMTPAEIKQMAMRLDGLDGVKDGKLAPTVVWPTKAQPKVPPESPEDYLKKLEDR